MREKFLAWLAAGLPEGLLRAKGFFWFAEQAADIGCLSVAGGLVLGSLPFLIGLTVVLPILGHATWHGYRETIDAGMWPLINPD